MVCELKVENNLQLTTWICTNKKGAISHPMDSNTLQFISYNNNHDLLLCHLKTVNIIIGKVWENLGVSRESIIKSHVNSSTI